MYAACHTAKSAALHQASSSSHVPSLCYVSRTHLFAGVQHEQSLQVQDKCNSCCYAAVLFLQAQLSQLQEAHASELASLQVSCYSSTPFYSTNIA
jgi:hypothetical protein